MRGMSHAGDRDRRSAGDVRPCAYVPLHLPGDDGPIQNSQSMHFVSYGQTDSLGRGCHEAMARAVALASAVSRMRKNLNDQTMIRIRTFRHGVRAAAFSVLQV